MFKKRIVLAVLASSLILAACGSITEQDVIEVLSAVEQTAAAGVTFVPAEATQNLDQIVQATFQAITAQAAAQSTPVPSATQGGTDNIPTFTPPAGQSGSISGALGYPAEGIPPMAIVAYVVGGLPTDYYYTTTIENTTSYQIDNLPVGSYHIVAYTMGGGGWPVGFARSEERR